MPQPNSRVNTSPLWQDIFVSFPSHHHLPSVERHPISYMADFRMCRAQHRNLRGGARTVVSAGDCDFQVSDAPLHARQPLFAFSLSYHPFCARSPARRASRKLLERIVEFIRLLDCGDKIVEYNQEQCRLRSFKGKTSLIRSFPSKVRKISNCSLKHYPTNPSSFLHSHCRVLYRVYAGFGALSLYQI